MQVDLPQLGTVSPEPNGGLLLAGPGSPDDGELRAGPGLSRSASSSSATARSSTGSPRGPPIVFLRHRCVPERPRLCVIIPRVNRMAAMLAEAHAAARLDALPGRGLRARTTQLFQTWREAYRGALTRAQQRQIVLATVDPSDIAHLLVAQIEGTLSLARNTQDPQTLTTGARALRAT